jgi:thiopurine S-methyltransferase
MEAAFWHQRWANGEIGFHESQPNPMLVNHLDALRLSPGSRIFLPLCGKTLDIGWLLNQGMAVVGIELNRQAVAELFAGLGTTPQIEEIGALVRYCSDGLCIFVGDIFDLTPEVLGGVDAVYDRAALVALPPEMRTRYCRHLLQLTGNAPQLLVTFEYDQTAMAGPPHSVPETEIHSHYGNHYNITRLYQQDVPGGMKGQTPATEAVWLLKKHSADG